VKFSIILKGREMNISAKSVGFDDNGIWVELSVGLGISLAWFHQLLHATPEQRQRSLLK
jgi:hypothetical protein